MTKLAYVSRYVPMAGRNRKRPMHPFIQELMDSGGFSNLREMCKVYNIEKSRMYSLADGDARRYSLEWHDEVAHKFGFDTPDWVAGYLQCEA